MQKLPQPINGAVFALFWINWFCLVRSYKKQTLGPPKFKSNNSNIGREINLYEIEFKLRCIGKFTVLENYHPKVYTRTQLECVYVELVVNDPYPDTCNWRADTNDECLGILPILGAIHKPRGQIFGIFDTLRGNFH